jgi:hypothetical protein
MEGEGHVMPAKTKTLAVPAPKSMPAHYTVEDIAEAKGVTPSAVHRDLHRGRRFGGLCAGAVVPAPDPAGERPPPFARILLWSVDREDVQAFLADPSVVVWK